MQTAIRSRIFELKPKPRAARTITPSMLLRLADALKFLAGRIANRLHIPAIIQEIDISDPVTSQEISIAAHPLFTVVRVKGRDYYFHRFSGRYNGAGIGCS